MNTTGAPRLASGAISWWSFLTMRTGPHSFVARGEGLRAALVEVALRIAHIGSTSVPDLAAKPTIDIQIAVKVAAGDGFAARLAAAEVDGADALGTGGVQAGEKVGQDRLQRTRNDRLRAEGSHASMSHYSTLFASRGSLNHRHPDRIRARRRRLGQLVATAPGSFAPIN